MVNQSKAMKPSLVKLRGQFIPDAELIAGDEVVLNSSYDSDLGLGQVGTEGVVYRTRKNSDLITVKIGDSTSTWHKSFWSRRATPHNRD